MSTELPSPASLPPFVYTKLVPGTIRVLVPRSSRSYSGHAWHLRTVRMGDKDLVFDALSYCWGLLAEMYPISVGGRRLDVHQNLYHALPYLVGRERGRPTTVDLDDELDEFAAHQERPIWIDAICINQSDEEEKTEQIGWMHKIYGWAETVWVWLGIGEEQEKIPEAIRLLHTIIEAGRGIHDAVEELEAVQRYAVGEKIVVSHGLNDLEPSIWSAIVHLLANPWFSRVWVCKIHLTAS